MAPRASLCSLSPYTTLFRSEPSMQDTLEPATKNHFGTWQGSWHVTDNHGVHVTVDERRFSVDFGDGPTEHLWQTKQITDETRFRSEEHTSELQSRENIV